MKNMANEARKTMVSIQDIKQSPSAKETYAREVASLDAKLNLAILNKPKEQLAQAKANAIVAEKRKMDPDLTQKELKKIRQQALVDARITTGAARQPFPVSEKEWEAIQAGAISANKLTEILQYMDNKQLKEYVMPHEGRTISPTKQTKILAMASQGYTPSEIADATGVSVSTVNRYIDK
jgi:DNA-binding NarL/FixJ family response regulator